MAEETYSTDGAECPYCRHVDKACDSDGILYSESNEEWTCGSCDKLFLISLYVQHSWTATPDDDVSQSN